MSLSVKYNFYWVASDLCSHQKKNEEFHWTACEQQFWRLTHDRREDQRLFWKCPKLNCNQCQLMEWWVSYLETLKRPRCSAVFKSNRDNFLWGPEKSLWLDLLILQVSIVNSKYVFRNQSRDDLSPRHRPETCACHYRGLGCSARACSRRGAQTWDWDKIRRNMWSFRRKDVYVFTNLKVSESEFPPSPHRAHTNCNHRGNRDTCAEWWMGCGMQLQYKENPLKDPPLYE